MLWERCWKMRTALSSRGKASCWSAIFLVFFLSFRHSFCYRSTRPGGTQIVFWYSPRQARQFIQRSSRWTKIFITRQALLKIPVTNGYGWEGWKFFGVQKRDKFWPYTVSRRKAYRVQRKKTERWEIGKRREKTWWNRLNKADIYFRRRYLLRTRR